MAPRDDAAELRHEQAYADWAIGLIAAMEENARRVRRGATSKAEVAAADRMLAARLAQLASGRSEPIFGRLDMVDGPGGEPETWYIGKIAIEDESRDPVVVEWQAPIANRFYSATASDPMGIGRRRTIRMKVTTVTAISDETLTTGFAAPVAPPTVVAPPVVVEVDVPEPAEDTASEFQTADAGLENVDPVDEPTATEASAPPTVAVGERPHALEEPAVDLRAADILLAELDESRTGAMSEIVATIQADQNRMIRADHTIPLVVQGSPGTGKTVVGLHRAAYVLYQQARRGQDRSVLVVGPNEGFITYISGVLPALGETTAVQLSLGQLFVSNLPPSARRTVKVRAVDTPEAALIKGDGRMAETVRRAVWAMSDPEGIELGFRRFQLKLGRDDVAALITTWSTSRITYRDARAAFVDRIADALFEIAVSRRGAGEAFGDGDREDIARLLRLQFEQTRQDQRIMPNLAPVATTNRLLDEPERLVEASGGWLNEAQAGLLVRPKTSRGAPWTRADLPILDEVVAVIAGSPPRFGHVVVDEAQDLSPMEWLGLRRRIAGRSLTVLGDLAQKTSVWPGTAWDELLEPLGFDAIEQVSLATGYRVPREVLEFADQILPWTAPGLAPTVSFRSTEAPVVVDVADRPILDQVAAMVAVPRAGSTAVVAARSLCGPLRKGLSDDAVTVLDPDQVKGLEFDHVIVVEPAAIVDEAPSGLQELYVSLTRPTQTLTVVHAQPLPPALLGVAPSATRRTRPRPKAVPTAETESRPRPPRERAARRREPLVAANRGEDSASPPASAPESTVVPRDLESVSVAPEPAVVAKESESVSVAPEPVPTAAAARPLPVEADPVPAPSSTESEKTGGRIAASLRRIVGRRRKR